MFEFLWNVIKTVALGAVVLVILMITITNHAWVGLWEQDVPVEQVNVASLDYEVFDYAGTSDKVFVTALIENNSAMNVSDFTTKFVAYDCATEATPLANCTVLTESDDSYGEEIAAGSTGVFTHSFHAADKLRTARGAVVFDVQFSDFQGNDA